MLIQEILQDPVLRDFLCDDCEEHGIGINVSEIVNRKDYVIIRVDEYYNTIIKDNSRPKSPDCLIIQHCGGNRFVLYLIELKAIASLRTEKLSDIRDKFQNCFDDFMSDKFRHYFYNTDYDFSIRLLFISDPKEGRRESRNRPTRMDNLLALPPCSFGNRKYQLYHESPNPTVQPCQ